MIGNIKTLITVNVRGINNKYYNLFEGDFINNIKIIK